GLSVLKSSFQPHWSLHGGPRFLDNAGIEFRISRAAHFLFDADRRTMSPDISLAMREQDVCFRQERREFSGPRSRTARSPLLVARGPKVRNFMPATSSIARGSSPVAIREECNALALRYRHHRGSLALDPLCRDRQDSNGGRNRSGTRYLLRSEDPISA